MRGPKTFLLVHWLLSRIVNLYNITIKQVLWYIKFIKGQWDSSIKPKAKSWVIKEFFAIRFLFPVIVQSNLHQANAFGKVTSEFRSFVESDLVKRRLCSGILVTCLSKESSMAAYRGLTAYQVRYHHTIPRSWYVCFSAVNWFFYQVRLLTNF